jgi:hypothetical protein
MVDREPLQVGKRRRSLMITMLMIILFTETNYNGEITKSFLHTEQPIKYKKNKMSMTIIINDK